MEGIILPARRNSNKRFLLSENERQLVWLRHAAGMQDTGVRTSGSAPAHRDLTHLPVLSRLSVR
jgi:hypothetical protein